HRGRLGVSRSRTDWDGRTKAAPWHWRPQTGHSPLATGDLLLPAPSVSPSLHIFHQDPGGVQLTADGVGTGKVTSLAGGAAFGHQNFDLRVGQLALRGC